MAIIRRGGRYPGKLQEMILDILREEKLVSTSRLTRLLGRSYSSVSYALNSLYRKGMVNYLVRYERIPGTSGFIKVVYWCLKDYGS